MKEGSWSLCVTSRTCWTVLIQALPPNLVSKVFQRLLSKTHLEMRSGAFDMPLQLEFDYRFSRAIKERLKRQCFTPFAYFIAPKSYYPQVFTTTYYNDLPKLWSREHAPPLGGAHKWVRIPSVIYEDEKGKYYCLKSLWKIFSFLFVEGKRHFRNISVIHRFLEKINDSHESAWAFGI